MTVGGRFRLAEHFVSINGEGQRAGELALFLRFAGCDLNCSWCDTKWANRPDVLCTAASVGDLCGIAGEACSAGVRNVTLTGGEPLLQEGIRELITALLGMGLRVEIETNGAEDLAPFTGDPRPVFTMDYKLPSSGMERFMKAENIRLLGENDTLKMVCASRQDLERAYTVITEHRPKCRVYLSPVFGMIEPADMVEFMKEKGLGDVRLQLQLHKLIWDPQERGV